MNEYSLPIPIRREEKEESQKVESPFGSFAYYSKILEKEIYEETNNKNDRRDTQESTKKKSDLKSPSLNELFNNLIINSEDKYLIEAQFREFMLSISRIGNNLNQIAYHLNSSQRDKDFLSNKFDEVLFLQKEIIKMKKDKTTK